MERGECEHSSSTKGASKERTLQVLFEVELADGCVCPISDPDSGVEDVHNQIDGDVCHAEVTVADEDDTTQVLHTANEVDDSCLCLTFSEVGCVPRLQRVDNGVILVETYVSNREVIGDLVDRLKSAAERVRLRRLTTRQRTESSTSKPTTVDLSHLTTKQREAATIAVSEGYYETPRQTSLDELSDTLGISKSALSQRLSAVESKLATAAFDP